MTTKLTFLLSASFFASLTVGVHAESDREKRAAKFKADQGLLIQEHQLGIEVKSGKISSEEYKKKKAEAQERARKAARE